MQGDGTPNLEHYTTYSEKKLLPIANIMLEYIIINPVQHKALFKKYSAERYYRCSIFVQAWGLERWPENGIMTLKKDLPEVENEIHRHREYVAAQEARALRRQEAIDREARA
ncbi:hypothetical protein BDN70DRAFT_337025 [Pholiota conissans]|uniref:Cyclin C-terminal domain-containing protein n=1 Tax=Pholiota conissans TaxID=109636 RepID=A0A9P5YQS3_9AGAR|nr:hypothetical protein BDN70DRAFT_337025 [Pholiota conissans]